MAFPLFPKRDQLKTLIEAKTDELRRMPELKGLVEFIAQEIESKIAAKIERRVESKIESIVAKKIDDQLTARFFEDPASLDRLKRIAAAAAANELNVLEQSTSRAGRRPS